MKAIEKVMATTMFIAIGLTILLSATSCGSTRYHSCDAYKTKYKAIKSDNHRRHHHICDAYN